MMRVNKKLTESILLTLLASAACADANPPSTEPAKQITIAQFGDFFLYAPLYVAQDGGFFKSEGLEVTIVSTGGDEKTWAAVMAGDAALGVADPTFVAIAGERGQKGQVVASIVNGVPFWGITTKALAPITDARALRGKTVATFPSPSTAYLLQSEMFKEAGIAPRIREGAPGTLLPLIAAGEADIALELEPNVSTAVANGATVVYSMREKFGDFAITGLTASSDYIAKNPEVIHAAICGIDKALKFIRAQPDSALNLLAKRFPDIPATVGRAALERVVQEGIVPSSVTIQDSAWEKAIRLRHQAGHLANVDSARSYLNKSVAETALRKCRG